jgi:hypothetical protein
MVNGLGRWSPLRRGAARDASRPAVDDPWNLLFGTGRGVARPAAIAEHTDERATTGTGSLLRRALALLDELRDCTSPAAPACDVSASAQRRAADHGMCLSEANGDTNGCTLIAHDATNGRLLGTLFATRLDPASGWSFNFQLDADAVADRPRP